MTEPLLGYQVLRDQVLDHYGRVCACPGCGATEGLTIDHVDPAADLATGLTSYKLCRWIIKNGFPEGFQILCKPCNSSKKDGPACRIDHSYDPAQATEFKRCPCPAHDGPNPLALEFFYTNSHHSGGRDSWCKRCVNQRKKAVPRKRPEVAVPVTAMPEQRSRDVTIRLGDRHLAMCDVLVGMGVAQSRGDAVALALDRVAGQITAGAQDVA